MIRLRTAVGGFVECRRHELGVPCYMLLQFRYSLRPCQDGRGAINLPSFKHALVSSHIAKPRPSKLYLLRYSA